MQEKNMGHICPIGRSRVKAPPPPPDRIGLMCNITNNMTIMKFKIN